MRRRASIGSKRRAPIWTANAGFSVHLAWHLALFHIDIDATPAAITIYVDAVAPHAAAATTALIDATALLWRLELRGVNVRGLWRELAHHWARTSLAGERAFTLVHAALAFAAAGIAHLGARVAALLRHDPATRAANTAQDLALAVPLTEGLQAYSRGDYAAAVERMTTVRAIAYRCGGSVAQCDLDSSDAGRGGSALAAGALGAGARGRARGAQAGQPAQPVAMRAREIQRLAGSHSARRVGRGARTRLIARRRDQHRLHTLVDLLGRVVRRIAPDDAARAIDEELGEVPLDRLGAEHAGLFSLLSQRYSGCAPAPLTSIFANSGNVTS